jgi:hypothetical protein
VTATVEATSSEIRTSPRRSRLTGLTVVVLLVLPALVAAVSLLGRHWFASGDQAFEVLRIGDVGGRHTPLVGVPSRFGWYHPGPLLFLVLAPAQRLLGETGVLAGTALVNAAALVGVAVVARRRGGTALLLWTGLLVAALVHALGPGLLLDPWNPWLALLPFLLFVFLAWSVACGDRPALPWAVGVGSFVVQTHVGYGLLVVGLLAVVLVVALARDRAGLGRWLALSGVVVLVLWLPPLIQQAAGHPGNLGEVARYFVHPPQYTAQQAAAINSGPVVGWKTGFGVMGEQLTPPGPWVTGRETDKFGFVASAAAWPGVLVILGAVGTGALAWWRGARDAARLAGVAVVLAVLGVVATARVNGFVAPYLVRWWWVVALVLWLSIGWCVASALGVVPARPGVDGPALGRRGLRLLAPASGLAAAAGTAALAVASVTAALPAPLPVAQASTTIAHLAPSTAAAVGRGGSDLLRWMDPESLSGIGPGMFTALRLAGLNVVAPPALASGVGSWRTAPPASFRGVITGLGLPDPTIASEAAQPPPGSRLVASYDPLSPQQRQEALTLQRRIRAAMGPRAPQDALVVSPHPFPQEQLVAAGADRGDVERLADLQARGSPYLVYFTPGQG